MATARTHSQSTDRVPSLQYRLVSQPLFWTSVVSMLLAVLCTIAIVVLCLTSSKRSRRACTAWSRGLRGSLSVAPPNAEDRKLNLDDDDDNCGSTDVSGDNLRYNNNLRLLELQSNRAIIQYQHSPRRAGNNNHHAGLHYVQKG